MKKVILLIVIFLLAIFFFPKKSGFGSYDTSKTNDLMECDCVGLKKYNKTGNLSFDSRCYGIPFSCKKGQAVFETRRWYQMTTDCCGN